MSKRTKKNINWSEYNRALIKRGDINLWLDDDMIKNWYAPRNPNPQRGRPFIYSDRCIELGLIFRSLFHLPLRATQGFMCSMFKLIKIGALKIPNYSSFSRRSKDLKVNISYKAKTQGITDIAVDSTGIKIFGEGEWKMRTHGKGKRRTWRKLHLAVDPDSHQIVSMELTKATVHDDQMMKPLLKGLKNIGRVYADGAYVSRNCFTAIAETGAKASIALRTGTSKSQVRGDPGLSLRDELVEEIWSYGGRRAWKKQTDHHKRSNVETCMYRFKKILGNTLSSRKFENQLTEARTKVFILNRMTHLGMPHSSTIT